MDAVVIPSDDLELAGAPEGLDALAVAEHLKAHGGTAVMVARDFQRFGTFEQAFRFFSQDVEILPFPAWDCLPYDRLSPTPAIAARRMATLTRLAKRDPVDARPLLILTTISAATQRTPPHSVTTAAAF